MNDSINALRVPDLKKVSERCMMRLSSAGIAGSILAEFQEWKKSPNSGGWPRKRSFLRGYQSYLNVFIQRLQGQSGSLRAEP